MICETLTNLVFLQYMLPLSKYVNVFVPQFINLYKHESYFFSGKDFQAEIWRSKDHIYKNCANLHSFSILGMVMRCFSDPEVLLGPP